MDAPTDFGDVALGSVPIVVYAAMLGATVAGQLLGMTLDAFVLGRHVLWIPAACSVALEALVGARLGSARAGRSLTAAECWRSSAYYSIGLAAISLPLWGWFGLSRLQGGSLSARAALDAATSLGAVLGALLVATFVRYGLMVLVARRLPPKETAS